MQNRAQLHLNMRYFLLSRDELLSLKPVGNLKSAGVSQIKACFNQINKFV